jgi:hypothetical protein
MFPKVTYNLEEYKELTHDSKDYYPSATCKALYKDGVIWLKKPNLLSLWHELVHHFLSLIGKNDGGTVLFSDFLNIVFEAVYSLVRYPKDQKQYWKEWFSVIKECWNDWMDWILCRN